MSKDTQTNATKERRNLASQLVDEKLRDDEPAAPKLGPDDYARHVPAYLKHNGIEQCTVCQHTDYDIHAPLVLVGPDQRAGPPLVPMPIQCSITCKQCGTTRFFSFNHLMKVSIPDKPGTQPTAAPEATSGDTESSE